MIQITRIDHLGDDKKHIMAKSNISPITCHFCSKTLTEGFVCENDMSFILCQACNDGYNFLKCKHDSEGVHKHIKWYLDDEIQKA